MKKVFIDTNVILDFLLGREGCGYAKQILQFGDDGLIRNQTSFLSMANIAYVLRKYQSHDETVGTLRLLMKEFSVLPMGHQQFYEALATCGPDIEDTLQWTCAAFGESDCIVTSDIRHFLESPIPVYTPKEFVTLLTE